MGHIQYFISGVSYVVIGLVVCAVMSYSAGQRLVLAAIVTTMSKWLSDAKAENDHHSERRINMIFCVLGGGYILFIFACAIDHLVDYFFGHVMSLATFESMVAAGTAMVAVIIMVLFRRAALSVRDEARVNGKMFKFWHG